MKNKFYLILLITICSFNFSNSQVGIGTAAPVSFLDVNGDLALREGTAIAVVTGANAITLTGEYSHYRLTGAAGAFNLSTITGGNDGQVLTLINATGQIMTITNNNVANGILTGNGVDLSSTGTANSSVSLIYNATLARWTVTGSTGTKNSNSWNITGNSATATDFIGTTSAQPFRIYANNAEAMRIITSGNVGVNTIAPVSKLEVTFNNVTYDALLGRNTNANGTGVNGVGQNGTWNGLVAGSGGSFSGVSTGTYSFYSDSGTGQAYYGADNFGAAWRIGHWTGSAYRKILGTGTVSTVVPDTNNEMVIMNCPESPENLFIDYGIGKLDNGRVYIKIDPILKKNIIVNELHPLKVFIQLEGECNGVYVTKKSDDGFEVIELNHGNSNIPFSYNIIATMGDQKTVGKEGNIRIAKYDTRWEKAPKPKEMISNSKK